MATRTPLWAPSPRRAAASQMHAFMQRIAQRHGVAATWESLREWSIRCKESFWSALLEFADIRPSAPANAVRVGDGMLNSRWFPGMRLNYARHMLRHVGPQDAVIAEDESGRTRMLSRDQLRDQVARFAAALRADGVRSGERVVGFMPNIPETLIAMLGAASLGAVWSSCSPDFGVGGVLDRFGQIEPSVLVVADGYSYAGKRIDLIDRVREMLPRLPSVRRLVVAPFVDAAEPAVARLKSGGATNAIAWGDYLGPPNRPAPALWFEEVAFDHPLFIMYSSGTTGVPKCIVHGHGGTLVQHMKELMLHSDLRDGERIFYFTTCGWMMWNWLVSGLGVGATVVLYEGNPAHPTVDRLWEIAARQKVSVFGTSPKFLGACEKAGLHPGRSHDLSALRCVLSTGSPLSEELFEWVYREVKSDLQLSSISGGTDIISCFMLGNPLLPVHAGEIQCRGLAMDVHAWNDAGRSVIGEKSELVCASPFPSQPVCFWNDPDQKKYRGAYFEHFSGVWRHGDFIEITDSGGVRVFGRSDATLNPGGVRIGTAEIYRIVEGLPEVVDSIAVARETADQDVDIILFVVLRAGLSLDFALEKRIREAVAAGATKRHVPRHIRQVRDIPRTISGKKVELAVTQLLRGEAVLNRDALANPETLEEYRDLRLGP
ncbi:MAG: acetoacetate--CoA ligase [Phycisphaerae bacterium]